MRNHRVLILLADVVKNLRPKHWTIDSSKAAYFNAETQREWEEVSEFFYRMTDETPDMRDTDAQYVNEWKWQGWKFNVAMAVDAPTGYEATA